MISASLASFDRKEDRFALIFRARLAEFDRQLDDGVLRHAGHADRGPAAVAFHEARHNPRPRRRAQSVHVDHLCLNEHA